MTDTEKQAYYKKQKNLYYIIAYIIGYVLPFAYFAIKMGVTKEVTTIVVPTVMVGFVGIIKLGVDIPSWVATWEPSLKKGMVKAVPKVLLFILLITLGLTLRYMLMRSIDLAFFTYFETVMVLFGGLALGSVFEAYHLKYKELYLISKGYVLGVVNK